MENAVEAASLYERGQEEEDEYLGQDFTVNAHWRAPVLGA
jgi:hypothetical protein